VEPPPSELVTVLRLRPVRNVVTAENRAADGTPAPVCSYSVHTADHSGLVLLRFNTLGIVAVHASRDRPTAMIWRSELDPIGPLGFVALCAAGPVAVAPIRNPTKS